MRARAGPVWLPWCGPPSGQPTGLPSGLPSGLHAAPVQRCAAST
eukprot:gene1103-6468_t